jgi:hypothetical protein
MVNQFIKEELLLLIGDQITSQAYLNIEDLFKALFGSDANRVPEVLLKFIRNEFIRQSKNMCRFLGKAFIAKSIQNGSSDFIGIFANAKAKEEHELIEAFPEEIKIRLKTIQRSHSLRSLLIEYARVFNRLRDKFSPVRSEDELRRFLFEWFQSGLMPHSIWIEFEKWNQSGPTLSNLRNIVEPSDSKDDTKWREFKRLLKEVQINDFVDSKQFQTTLNIFFAVPEIIVTNNRIKVIGKILYLSQLVSQIQNLLENTTEVAIFAEYSLGIDCNLTDEKWQGKNLIIVSKCVHVWQEVMISLSGKSFSPNKQKAKNATSEELSGTDGRDGRPGESSGNLVILASKMMNPGKMTAELNGGIGEDGEDGGNGFDGVDGVGVTEDEIKRLIVNYDSLYFDLWSNFKDYSPPSNWKKTESHHLSGKYIYRIYKDENNRSMTYSFAADKGYIYTTYELFFLICGSNGTSGTLGGSNGVGGEGGYNGINETHLN